MSSPSSSSPSCFYPIKVLDHGFVKYVDHLGSDETIVEAARMSTGRGFIAWEPYARCKKCDQTFVRTRADDVPPSCAGCGKVTTWENFPRGDLGILEYLYKNRHTTPFEMCELIIDVQVPMDVWRQWIRHRTASVNEYSTRYSEAIDETHQTPPYAWRTQGITNRQGSGECLSARDGEDLSIMESDLHNRSRVIYEERLKLGVAKEQARKDLPLSTYTAARWKIDLHNLLHFLSLRMHPHAQLEIRQYANAVAEITKSLWPHTYALFEEYSLYSMRLSRTDCSLILDWLTRNTAPSGNPHDSKFPDYLQKLADMIHR